MNDLGFVDFETNYIALEESDGNYEEAVMKILTLTEWSSWI